MTRDLFYELYRKLAAARKEPTTNLPVLDELAQVCRSRKKSTSSHEEWLADADNCLYEVAQSSTLFAAAVANWLTVDEDFTLVLARALIQKVSVQHLQQPMAESYDLSNIDEARVILAGFRLCTSYVAPAVSLGWTLSMAISFPQNGKIRQAVEHLLRYHVDEFPWTTQRLLSYEESPFNSVEEAQEILAVLDEQEALLDGFPRLREFAMTPEMRLTLFSLKRREQRLINRNSREASIFSQFCTTQYFKYATKTAVEFFADDKVQEMALTMSPYSVSIELPLSERTDPPTGQIRRHALWMGLPQ